MQKRELFSSLAQAFRDKKQKQELVLRPPYFGDESLFYTECVKCADKCSNVCDEGILFADFSGVVYLDFMAGGCTYCDKCAIHCKSGVLDLANKKLIDAKITIDEKRCLSWMGVMCFSCKEPCLDNAIDFKALFMPSINEKCTNCGFCIQRCPSDAIVIEVSR